MESLVIQLQQQALDSSAPVLDLLRRAKFAATKLDLPEFQSWANSELNGYEGDVDVPPYRCIAGSLKFLNPVQGAWRPVIFESSEEERRVCLQKIRSPLGTLEDILARTQEGSSPSITASAKLTNHICNNIGFATEVRIFLVSSTLANVPRRVRDIILDWTVDLEKRKVLGEGMQFTEKERESAHHMSKPTYYIQNVGVLGDVSQSTVTANQTATYSSQDLAQIAAMMAQIEPLLATMEARERERLADAVARIKEELQHAKPDHGKIRAGIASLRNICEGMVGSLIAAGILALTSGQAQ